jgi:hypothetical protein
MMVNVKVVIDVTAQPPELLDKLRRSARQRNEQIERILSAHLGREKQGRRRYAGPPPEERRSPGRLRVYVDGVEQMNDGAVRAPPPDAFPDDHIPIPDRWRLVESLGVKARWFDPYNQNALKGDRPLFGSNWFLNLSAISDTVIEPRSFPTPVGVQTTERPNSLDTIGRGDSFLFSKPALGASFINGSTAFKPPTPNSLRRCVQLRLCGGVRTPHSSVNPPTTTIVAQFHPV